MHPIEGLVLHQIGYNDRGRLRPIIYRASLSEMVVPYGSTAMNHCWKNAFDAGEWGLGKMANSLDLGCDCLGEIVYLDAVAVDEDGAATRHCRRRDLPARRGLRHPAGSTSTWRTGTAEVRRSRRLVVSSIATVGNYEYGFYWYFYLDGTIQFEVKLTGIIQTQAVAARRPGSSTPTRSPRSWPRPHHQHLFSFRLDMAWTARPTRSTRSTRCRVPAGPDNPHGNAFTVQEHAAGDRARGPADGRAASAAGHWKIVNHGIGTPAASRSPTSWCRTHASAPLLAQPDAAIASARRVRHPAPVGHPVPRDDELRAAGEFPNQHPGGDGLPAWTAADRPVTDTDIVLWHTVGVTHSAGRRTSR